MFAIQLQMVEDLPEYLIREGVKIRAVESESREKSKNRKKSDKIGKIGIDFLLDFFRLFGNY